MNIIKSTVFGLSMAFFAIAMVVSTPVAQAQWDGSGMDGGSFDGGGCCSFDSGSSNYDTFTPDQTSYYDTFTPDQTSYYDTFTPDQTSYSDTFTPDQGYAQGGYSSPGYYGGGSAYSSPSYYSSTPSYPSNYETSRSSTYAPYTSTYSPYTSTVRDNGNSCTTPGSCSTDNHSMVRDNGNTSTCTNPYSCSTTTTTNIHDNGNTIDSNNSCVQPGSCSTTTTDSHNTTISSPINIVSSNPPASQTQIIYNNPAPQPLTYNYTSPTPTPYTPAPTCVINVGQAAYGQSQTLTWSSTNAVSGSISNVGNVAVSGSTVINPNQGGAYTATFSGQNGQVVTCSTVARQVVTTQHAAAVPYVTLSQVPYTGLDLGPAGLVIYWSFLVLWCLFMAYLIVVKQTHLKLAATLKSVVFGDEIETTPATPAQYEVAADQNRAIPAYSAPEVQKTDAIDDFILTQIHRA